MGLVFFAWVWGRKGARPWELVVHSGEWTTSWGEKAGKGPEPGKEAEPVAHFGEWTTGWGGLPFLAMLSLLF